MGGRYHSRWITTFPKERNGSFFSPHNADTQIFQTGLPGLPDNSFGGAWDGRIYLSSYHAGLWVIDIETLMFEGLQNTNKTDAHASSTVGYHLPHGADGAPLDSSFYDFWLDPVPMGESIMMATHISLVSQVGCISSN